MSSRRAILDRIAVALEDVPASELPEHVEVPRNYAHVERGNVVERFVERIADYETTVRRVTLPGDTAGAIAERCLARGVRRLGVPSDLPDDWRPAGVELVRERFDPRELDALDGALTGCALAIAETGTIVLDTGARQGSRALTLVPDYHLCVVDEDQIVGGVQEAMVSIAAITRRLMRPVTFISGPSATSDIEMSRVEGVHGPRTLDVLVVAKA
jgi:L-lactate dehydrogenase complex protein LldG